MSCNRLTSSEHSLKKFIAWVMVFKLTLMSSWPLQARCPATINVDNSGVVKNGVLFFLSTASLLGSFAETIFAGQKCSALDNQINSLSYTDPTNNRIAFQCHPDCYYAAYCIGSCSPSSSDFDGCQTYIYQCLNLTSSRGPWVTGAVVGGLLLFPLTAGVLHFGKRFMHRCSYAQDIRKQQRDRYQFLKDLSAQDIFMQSALNNLMNTYKQILTNNDRYSLSILDTLLHVERGLENDELCPSGAILSKDDIIAWLSKQKPLVEKNYQSYVNEMKYSERVYDLIALHAHKNDEAITLRKNLKKLIKSKNKENEISEECSHFLQGVSDSSNDLIDISMKYQEQFSAASSS
jgi:hypothetical protein